MLTASFILSPNNSFKPCAETLLFGKLIYCPNGTVSVFTSTETFTASPQLAIWIPPKHKYQIKTEIYTDIHLLLMKIDHLNTGKTSEVLTIEVTALLRELLVKVKNLTSERTSIQNLLLETIVEELSFSRLPSRFTSPLLTNTLIKRIVNDLEQNPDNRETLSQWANKMNMSKRSFERLFVREVGMPFDTWRIRMRIEKSLELLKSGYSVKASAYMLGFKKPSAFIQAFKKIVGHTPGHHKKIGHLSL